MPPPRIFLFIFYLKMASSDAYLVGSILCDLELHESKQETRYRPGKSKGAGTAGSPTRATRPHLSPA